MRTSSAARKGASYRAFAVRQLLALASPAYFAAPGENGGWLLKHGVGHKPGDSEVDTPLCYGDYYFLEALLRFRLMAFQAATRDSNTPPQLISLGPKGPERRFPARHRLLTRRGRVVRSVSTFTQHNQGVQT